MILSAKDLQILSRLHREVAKYMGVKIKKIKERSASYLSKNGIDINEILTSRFIPGRIASDIKKRADLDFHLEALVGGYELNLFFFNDNEMRVETAKSLSPFKSEADEFGETFMITAKKSSRPSALESYLSETIEAEEMTALGGGKVGKKKQFKNLNMEAFGKMFISGSITGDDLLEMCVDGLSYCLSCKTPRKRYSFIIYPSYRAKELPSIRRYEDEFIQDSNVNSGMTIVNLNAAKTSISAVVRQEEMAKVFLHELVHASLVDVNLFGYYSGDLVQLENKIRKDLRISQATPLAIGESATEAMAEQLYFTMLSLRASKKLGLESGKDDWVGYLYTMMKRELEFCELQMMKVLYFYGFRKASEFLRATKSDRSMPKLATPTNLFGYVFLRYGLISMFFENSVRGVISKQVDTSIYEKVKEDRQLVLKLYERGYKILRDMIRKLEDARISERISVLEAQFPEINELSLRFISCDGIKCIRM